MNCRNWGLIGWKRVLVSAAALAAVFLTHPGLVTAKVVSFDESWIRPGVMIGEKDTDYYVDFFVPFLGTDSRLFFFNPQVRFDNHDGDEEHLGLGYRRLYLEAGAILGANLYYDTMKSALGNRYDQVGFGVECLSNRFDFRANYYNPTGDADRSVKDFDLYSFARTSFLVNKGYEEALKGFDAELGALIPGISDVVETRVYLGGYGFQSDHFEDVNGFRGRLEIRPIPLLNLDIEYRDDDVRGSETFGGLYVDIPFKGAGELTKFGTGARPLTDRLVEKIVRDRHIVTLVGSAENPTKIADMIYVNADNSDFGTGTLDDPYQDISMAPSSTLYEDGAWIYVFSWDEAADVYTDVNLWLSPGMVLWGQGYKDPLSNLGGGPKPIFDGGGVNNIITLTDDNEIRGLTIQNGDVGIFGQAGVRTTFIHDNLIQNNNRGIWISNASRPFSGYDVFEADLSYTFADNQLTGYVISGIEISTLFEDSFLVSDLDISHTFTGNFISGNGAAVPPAVGLLSEISINALSVENVSIAKNFSGNEVTGNIIGIDTSTDILAENGTIPYVLAAGLSNITVQNEFAGNNIDSNTDYGILQNDFLTASVSLADGSTVIGDPTAGLSGASITNTFTGNTVTNNGYGVFNQTLANALVTASNASVAGNVTATVTGVTITNDFVGNNVSGNTEMGVNFIGEYPFPWWDFLYAIADLQNVTLEKRAPGIGGDVSLTVSDVAITNNFTENTINSNLGAGLMIGPTGWVGLQSDGITMEGNLTALLTETTIVNRFTDNDISGNGGSGVDCGGWLRGDIQFQNAVVGDEAAGTGGNVNLTISDSAIDNTFTGNTINSNYGPDSSGIAGGVSVRSAAGAAIFFSGNVIGNITSEIVETNVTNQFVENDVGNNHGGGIKIQGCWRCHTMAAEVFGSDSSIGGDVTARLVDSGVVNTFTGNRIYSNTAYDEFDPGLLSGNRNYAWAYVSNSTVGGDLTGSVTGTTYVYRLIGNDFSGNAEGGVDLGIYSMSGGELEVFMEDNTVIGNGANGVAIEGQLNSSNATIDLGGGDLGSAGGNSLWGNNVTVGGYYDLYNDTEIAIYAESNWWGDDDPSDQIGGDPVDYTPWLTYAP